MPEPEPTAQDAMMALDLYQRQLEAVSRQIELLQGVLDDVSRAKRTLEGLAEEASKEVLVPLGASTFLRGIVTDKERVIAGIGAGYATEKTRDAAVKLLGERETQVNQELERLMGAAVQLQHEAAAIQERLEQAPDGGRSAR